MYSPVCAGTSDNIGVGTHFIGIKQGSTQFGHSYVAILSYNFGKQRAVWFQLTFASRSPLWQGLRAPFPSDSKRPSSTCGGQ